MGAIDILLLVVLAIVTWAVASEGAWGALLSTLIVLFSGLLSMNFFEPFAGMLQGLGGSLWWQHQCDIIALVGLFGLFVFLLRIATDRLSPRFIQTNRLLHELGRWGGGLMAGYITMAFLLTSLHTGPFPREFWGFSPERRNLFNVVAPDRQWLGFTQWVSEHTLKWGGAGKIFDGPRPEPRLGGSQGAENRVWPSFVIRYATRRRLYAMGGGATSGAGGGAGPTIRVEEGAPGTGKRDNF